MNPKKLQWGRGLKTPEMRRKSPSEKPPSPLQWGRGLKTPEISNAERIGMPTNMLQWGRGLKTPEMGNACARKAETISFNGAGVLRPRKYQQGMKP